MHNMGKEYQGLLRTSKSCSKSQVLSPLVLMQTNKLLQSEDKESQRFYLARRCSPTQDDSSGLQILRTFLGLWEVGLEAASSITQSSQETALYKADPISYITVEQQSHANMDTCKA